MLKLYKQMCLNKSIIFLLTVLLQYKYSSLLSEALSDMVQPNEELKENDIEIS